LARVAAGHGSGVPLLIGSNEDEGSLFSRPPMRPLLPTSDVAVRRFLQQDHPDVIDQVLGAYARRRPVRAGRGRGWRRDDHHAGDGDGDGDGASWCSTVAALSNTTRTRNDGKPGAL
jgi:hypothetical protein